MRGTFVDMAGTVCARGVRDAQVQKAAGFPVTAACTAAGVLTSGFYDWQTRQAAGPTARQIDDAEIVALMREI